MSLSTVACAVQAKPLIGRYTVTVVFVDHKPAFFDVTHSNGKLGVAISRSNSLDPDELEQLLDRCYKEFGPEVLIIPFH